MRRIGITSLNVWWDLPVKPSGPQFSSVTQSCLTLHSHELLYARLPCLSSTPGVYLNTCLFTQPYGELVMPSNHLILCHPLLLPSTFPSLRVFSSESVLCIRWPKYWSFSFSNRPSIEYSGLMSFRMDWLDLLAV